MLPITFATTFPFRAMAPTTPTFGGTRLPRLPVAARAEPSKSEPTVGLMADGGALR
jgi:hypothetical protein